MEQKEKENKKTDVDKLRDKVGKNVADAETFLNDYFADKITYLDNNYKGIRTKAENTLASKSNMFIGLSFGIVETEKIQSINGMYSKDDFFALKFRDKGDVKGDVDGRKSARAMEKLMFAQQSEMGLYSFMSAMVTGSLIRGNGFGKMTMDFSKKENSYYDVDAGKTVKITKRQGIKKPLVEQIDFMDMLIDPNAKSIEDAQYICQRMYVKPEDIWDNPMYNMTDEVKKLKEEFEDLDEQDRPIRIEMYEHWENNEVTTVTGAMRLIPEEEVKDENGRRHAGSYVIRHHGNPYKHGKKPFFTMVKYPTEDSVYGYGSLEMVSDIQEFTNDMFNNASENALMSIHKAFLVKSSSDLGASDVKIGAGSLIKVRNLDDIKQLEMGSLNSDFERTLGMSDSYLNRITGNLDQIDNRSGKSATESRIIAERANNRFQAYNDFNRENFLKPLISMWIELNQQYIDKEDAKDIIGETWASVLGLEEDNVDLNVNYDFVLTGEAGKTDKLTSIENLKAVLELMGAVVQLPPELFDIHNMAKFTLSKLDMPPDFLMAQEDVEQQKADGDAKKAVIENVEAFAKSKGMTGEQLIMKLAQEQNTSPEELLSAIIDAGGIENFLGGK